MWPQAIAAVNCQPPAASSPIVDAQQFLAQNGPKLAVCRTPMNAVMRDRWKQTFARLDEFLARCRTAKLPVALVLVPTEFQVNRNLLSTLRRRMGYAEREVDLELPQRRFAMFAQDRAIPVIDLLPHLQASDEPAFSLTNHCWTDRAAKTVGKTIGGWLAAQTGPSDVRLAGSARPPPRCRSARMPTPRWQPTELIPAAAQSAILICILRAPLTLPIGWLEFRKSTCRTSGTQQPQVISGRTLAHSRSKPDEKQNAVPF